MLQNPAFHEDGGDLRSNELRLLAQRCPLSDPTARPTFQEISLILKVITVPQVPRLLKLICARPLFVLTHPVRIPNVIPDIPLVNLKCIVCPYTNYPFISSCIPHPLNCPTISSCTPQ